MGNVSQAMKKHQTDQGEKKGPQLPKAPPAQPPPPAIATVAESPAGDAPAVTSSTSAVATAVMEQAAAPPREKASGLAAPVNMEEARKYSRVLVSHYDREGVIAEQYRALRARLQARHNDGKFCTLITSSQPGEGKTVTSTNLAIIMAGRSDCKVALLDCDFRRNRVANLLGMPRTAGAAEYLLGKAQLPEIIQPTAYPSLSVVQAGHCEDDHKGELAAHPRMEDLVQDLRKKHDIVLIDTAPVNVVSDATMLGRWADDALLVVRMDSTRRESIEKAIRTLNDVEIALAGIVLTHKRYYIPDYLYRYS